MNNPAQIFTNCDNLEQLPELNRKNYIFESELLIKDLPQNALVLQIGSMDGRRLFRLQEERPDLKLTGLEIEEELIKTSTINAKDKGHNIKFILGDITNPPDLPLYDYVMCLNNTLGYIPHFELAIKNMKKLGGRTILSVYGEKFTDTLAEEYFNKIGLEILEINNNMVKLKDFTKVKRFTKEEIYSWGGVVSDTPLGYYVTSA